MPPAQNVIFDPTEKQNQFIRDVMSGQYRHMLYGGSAGGGKSFVICALVLLFCRLWPGSRWALCRRDLPRLRRNLLPTFKKIMPKSFVGPPNQVTWESTCSNGSTILFLTLGGESDNETDYDRLRGLELDGAAFDEINEFPEAAFHTICSRLGRWSKRGPKAPPPLVLATANPNQSWVKQYWYEPWAAGTLPPDRYYLPASVLDNPYLANDAEYMANLHRLPEAQQRVYLKGDWSVADDPCQLVSAIWLQDAFKRIGPDMPRDLALLDRERWMGVDVGYTGEDSSVIAVGRQSHVEHLEAHKHVDTLWLANRVAELAQQHSVRAKRIRVDGAGPGAGVLDGLAARGIKAHNFISGGKPTERQGFFTFRNRRAQAWWDIRAAAEAGKLSIAQSISAALRLQLEQDIIAQRYKVDGDKMLTIEPKDAIKKRLGRSPDVGDAVMMGMSEGGTDALDKMRRLATW